MKITNNQNLPEPLYRAISEVRPRKPGRLSVTDLINPPQQRYLVLKHWEEMEEDASGRIWAGLGQLMHKLLEGHGDISDHLPEAKLEIEVEGYTVVGVADLYHQSGRITDYKFVSVWSSIDGVKVEWEQQLNLYAEIFRRSGFPVTSLEIVAMFRDWSRNRAHDPSYPQSQVRVYRVPLWSEAKASEFLIERVKLHIEGERGSYAPCTPQERWERPTVFALMKEGRKSAVKLYDTAEAAYSALNALTDFRTHSVVIRRGESIRCESYCAAAPWCKQRAAMIEKAA